ncbi:uncharacterized protein LOC110711344 [Chenopodium quinoa]|uniref:uncharacterized protein LOC110711344 n=1 Tax=Chenopodium quinoa TaxID=63459 RepID=UPI000B791E01|nr:uncharacterized protein LOC110711344 [Chenopodium quinoa]
MGEDPDPNANALIEQLREELGASIEWRQKLEEESQATLARLKAESEASLEKLSKELESVRSNKKKRVKIDDIPQFTLVSSDESEGEDAGEGSRGDEEQSDGNPHPMASAPKLVAYESRDGFAESPFVEEIAKVRIPAKLSIPSFPKMYDGTTDPQDHVGLYKLNMWQLSILWELIEPTMCTIASFSSLVNKFYQQFATSRELDKQSTDLYRIVQKQNETTRQYWDRFNREIVSIKTCDHSTAIEAFCKGLNYRSSWKPRRSNVNSISEPKAGESSSWPAIEYHLDINSYGFDTDIVGVVNALKDIGQPVRWPRKSDKPDHQKDKSRWCEYHGDHGHRTDECNSLKREVAWLPKRGYLKDLLGKKGKGPEVKQEALPGPPASPTPGVVIQAISRGSSINGLTYSNTKRIARVGTSPSSIPQTYPSSDEKKLDDMAILFDESRFNEPEHHDCLVISLHVGQCKMKRVLVDNGNSAYIIFKDALDQAGFKESDITKRSIVLIGFNGEPMNSLAEIQLPTLLKGINMMHKFYVIDCKIAYNVIVGTPWIHKMKAISYTYHQLLKFPSQWGVAVAEGDRKQARECYQLALKPHGPTI